MKLTPNGSGGVKSVKCKILKVFNVNFCFCDLYILKFFNEISVTHEHVLQINAKIQLKLLNVDYPLYKICVTFFF